MTEAVFILNVNPGGVDVLHRNPLEVCNTDQVEGRQSVDVRTAAELIARGVARPCEHCIDMTEEPT
jgi:hypothetical protein